MCAFLNFKIRGNEKEKEVFFLGELQNLGLGLGCGYSRQTCFQIPCFASTTR